MPSWLPSSTSAGIFGSALALVVAHMVTSAVRNVFLCPIPRPVPGPWLAKLTSKWMTCVELSGARATTINKLHERYGPVAQLGSNEVSFKSPDCVRAIYGTGTTCVKPPAYDAFGKKGMFQMQDPAEHRARQKQIAHVFAPRSLLEMESLIQDVTAQLVEALRKRAGTAVDSLHWTRMAALDNAGEILLGKSFDAVKGDGQVPLYVHHLDNAYLSLALYANFPILYKILESLPIPSLRQFLSSKEYVYEYGDNAMKECISRFGRESKRQTIITRMISGDPYKGTAPLSDDIISLEVSNAVFAATDTTGNAMSYALYRMASHPDWQAKLRDEIRSSGSKAAGYPFQTLQALPILHGVMNETLRLHPPAPASLPRMTTRNGCEIGGMYFPGKTLVSMQAYTTNRHPNCFPEPEAFKPDRWIANGTITAGSSEQRDMSLSWGKGTRSCLGQHMAVMELKIMLARVVDDFEVTLESLKTHDDMKTTDHFTLIPKGGRCGLVFSPAV
ncbi:cytochrome P450 [Plectosphaerella plurivora]|uniref:Cytochrome P450 n=1 Tax=Plectosphaerella plurivora TaxID=936078 RepID=A0A9P8VNH3_9PEZI|nr:cytochrome P450 [Plectosphaerella plurivora]